VRHVLVPTLAKGDILILGSHKGKAERQAIRNAGAHLLFLPAYSPALNTIEQVFAKIKHLMRNASPRTIKDTSRTHGEGQDRCSISSPQPSAQTTSQTQNMLPSKNVML
jgi:putative transposase